MEEYCLLLQQEVLLPPPDLAAPSLAYHTADVFLPQLALVCDKGTQIPGKKALASLLRPFCTALALNGDPAMIQRLR